MWNCVEQAKKKGREIFRLGIKSSCCSRQEILLLEVAVGLSSGSQAPDSHTATSLGSGRFTLIGFLPHVAEAQDISTLLFPTVKEENERDKSFVPLHGLQRWQINLTASASCVIWAPGLLQIWEQETGRVIQLCQPTVTRKKKVWNLAV